MSAAYRLPVKYTDTKYRVAKSLIMRYFYAWPTEAASDVQASFSLPPNLSSAGYAAIG
jgi:hypothetical protein